MTKRKLRVIAFLTALPAAGLLACSGQKKADVAQQVAKAEHNPAQCPKLDNIKGDFAMKDGQQYLAKQVNIQDNADQKLLIVTFDGKEQILVNGQKQPQENGGNLTGACVNNSIHIVGTDAAPDKNFVDFRLRVSDDGKTLFVDRNEPYKMTFHYDKTDHGPAVLSEKTKELMDKLSGNDKKKSGLPTQEDKKPQEPQKSAPQQ